MPANRIFLSPPFLDGNERRYVDAAFESNYIAPCGPMVDGFEKGFSKVTGIENAVALSGATAALDLIYEELGVGAGDTVFCSDLTFVASIGPAIHRRAIPVFIDCDEATWTMSPVLLEQALKDASAKGKLPKAIVAVDLYGQCCDYAAIEPLCESYGVPLVVDSAEALGSKFTDASGKVHSAGDAGFAAAFSFNGNKIITTSGGGMLASHDAALVADARNLSQQARDPFPWYEHSRVGYNYRMSNIVAAIGLGQLERLEAKVQRKREIFDLYRKLFADLPQISFMPEAPYCLANRWLTVITIGEGYSESSHQLAISNEQLAILPDTLSETGRAGVPLPAAGMEHGEWGAADSAASGCVANGGFSSKDNTGVQEQCSGRRVGGTPLLQNVPAATTAEGSRTITPEQIRLALEAENIESRPLWKPMHMQPVFKDAVVYGGEVGERLFRTGLCLPSGAGMTDDDVKRVSDAVHKAFETIPVL